MAKNYRHLTTPGVHHRYDDARRSGSLRSIAKRLRRSASTISREVQCTSGASIYDANRAHAQCHARRLAPRRLSKLCADGVLFQVVRHQLKLLWSPQQIARKLRRLWPDNLEKTVSH